MEAPFDTSQLLNLTFSYKADPKIYQKVFCVSPPSDTCPFKVSCPNTDVTGIGQQISIYLTTSIYAIVLAYIPGPRRPMLYAHLSAIYSLLIAALISIKNGELSSSDGTFVIVTVASPASIILWFHTVRSFIQGLEHFPMTRGGLGSKPVNKAVEVQSARALALFSLIFTLVMICLIFIPNIPGINFPQKACDELFSASTLWYNVVWQLPIAVQACTMLVYYWMLHLCFVTLAKRDKSPPPSFNSVYSSLDMVGHLPQPMHTVPSTDPLPGLPTSTKDGEHVLIDLISWTEKMLFDMYPKFMNSALFKCIVAIMQLPALPTLNLGFAPLGDATELSGIILLAYGLFCRAKKNDPPRLWVYRVGALALTAWICAGFPISIFGFYGPNVGPLMALFISLSTAKWTWNMFSGSVGFSIKYPIVVFNVISVPILVFLGLSIGLIDNPRSFATTDATPDGAQQPGYFSLHSVVLMIWIVAWLSTSAWPWNKRLTWSSFNQGLWARAHMMKIYWIVIGPHILWIQASNNTNVARSVEMTFGQLYTVIISTAALVVLLDELRGVKMNVWRAVLRSEFIVRDQTDTHQPPSVVHLQSSVAVLNPQIALSTNSPTIPATPDESRELPDRTVL